MISFFPTERAEEIKIYEFTAHFQRFLVITLSRTYLTTIVMANLSDIYLKFCEEPVKRALNQIIIYEKVIIIPR